MSLNIEKKFSDVNTIVLSGRLDTVTAPQLEAELEKILSDSDALVLDMANLEYISSAGLRVILKAQKAMNTKGTMKLIHVGESIMEVFDITGFSDFFMIDTGGGSTEIALVKGGEVINSVSVPWGSVVLTEMFSSGKTLTADEFKNVIAHISDGLASFDWVFSESGIPMCLLGGSLRNWYDYKDEYSLGAFAEKMLSMTVAEREEFGIKSRRSDTITAGLAPAMVLELITKPSEIIALDSGVKEGYIIEKIRGEKI